MPVHTQITDWSTNINEEKHPQKNEDAFPFLKKSLFSLQFCSPNHSLHIFHRSVEDALFLVERTYLLHLVVREGEVEDLDVFLDVVRIGGTGNNGETFLNVPTQDNLCGRLAVCSAIFLMTGSRSSSPWLCAPPSGYQHST